MKVLMFVVFGPLFLFLAFTLFAYLIDNERMKDIGANLITSQMILIALGMVVGIGIAAFS